MPVSIDPKDEKLWHYLTTHKRPITQDKMAKYFLISKEHAGRALNFFVQQGIAECFLVKRVKHYKVKT